MCFGGESDLGPPPRPRGPRGQYDPKYVEALEAYAHEQDRLKKKRKTRRRNGAIAAVAASTAASGGGGGGGGGC